MNMNEPGHISAFSFTISGSSWENTLSVFIQIIHRFLLGVSIHDIHPYARSFSSIHGAWLSVILSWCVRGRYSPSMQHSSHIS
jgi:hypothetical protein